LNDNDDDEMDVDDVDVDPSLASRAILVYHGIFLESNAE
jgi:hypothetical protein